MNFIKTFHLPNIRKKETPKRSPFFVFGENSPSNASRIRMDREAFVLLGGGGGGSDQYSVISTQCSRFERWLDYDFIAPINQKQSCHLELVERSVEFGKV